MFWDPFHIHPQIYHYGLEEHTWKCECYDLAMEEYITIHMHKAYNLVPEKNQ